MRLAQPVRAVCLLSSDADESRRQPFLREEIDGHDEER